MIEQFRHLLKRLVDEKFDSHRAFIRTADPRGNESSLVGHLSRIIEGTRPPPIDRLDAWADALGLAGDERQRFLDLAALAHLPAVIQPRFHRIYEEFQGQEARISALELRLKGRGK